MAGIVIVGGGLAAARTAEQLRRSEYAGPITIVSDEDHLPYDRPPLSKEVLRAETDDVTLKPAEFYAENDITLRLGSAAQSVDTAAKSLKLADGSDVAYDELIIATGLVPKRIRSFGDLAGIHVLRSYDESMALREHAGNARRAVVVGAGFIGCEVAASLRKLGVEVVLVEPQPTPLASVLGEQIGALVTRLHQAEGVDVRCGVGVNEVRGTDKVEGVVLGDGTELEADLVVVGIGYHPAVDWLEGQRDRARQRRGVRRPRPRQCSQRVGHRRRRVVARSRGRPSAGGTLEQCRRPGPGHGAGVARPGGLARGVGAVLLERSVRRQDPVPG